MNRNQYDTDITTWSPQGRLYQLEYALEAVKQGSATVGVKSATHAVLVALKRSPTAELSSFQEKMFKIDKHVGMSVSGLISDARILARFLRSECMDHRYMYGSSHLVTRLCEKLAEKSQRHTQYAGKRPFGVGLLLGGFDATGSHLFQAAPNGEVYDYKAIAIGARSQSARTYLEKHFTAFSDLAMNDLVNHALKALATTCPEGVTLTPQNTTIAIVGVDRDFTMYTDDETGPWLNNFRLAPEDRPNPETDPATGEPMDDN